MPKNLRLPGPPNSRSRPLWAVVPVLIVLLVSCDTRYRYDRNLHLKTIFEGNDNLLIESPSLSHDGAHLSFHFFERRSEAERSRYMIGLYDLQNGEVRIIEPPDSRLEWHSPSFDSTGGKLVLISACRDTACPPEQAGSNVAVLDMASGEHRLVTSSNMQEYIWYSRSGSDSLDLVPISLNRTSPVFSKDDTKVYYLGSRITPGLFGDERDFTIRKVDLASGEDGMVLNRESGAAYFSGDGSIAVVGESELIIFGGVGKGGEREGEFLRKGVFGYSYSVVEDRVTALFQGGDLPDSGFRRSPLPDSLTASNDASRLAYIAGRHYGKVVLWEGRRQRIVATKDELDFTTLGDLALSSDGRHLAILGGPLHTPGDLNHFWLIDLETQERRRLRLSAALRAAMKDRERGGQEVAHHGV